MFLTALAIATAAIHVTHPPDDSDALLLLDHKDLHDRWKPRTHHDALVSVYQMWNVLDRMNFATLHNHSLPWIYGYLRPVQLEALLQVVRSAGVSEYCEVGFNGGHSAVAVLTGAPNVSVRSFDNSAYGAHTKHNAEFLKSVFPSRFSFIDGNSLRTVPQLASRVHAGDEPPCDVILIDGSHKTPDVKKDLHAFRGAARCHAPIFMDDLEAGPGNAVDEAERDGLLRMRQWFVYDSRQRPGKKGNRTADRLGETTYLHDPQRVFNPCIRWFVHTRAVNFQCHLQWDEKRCAFCPPVFQWGVGQYARCNHREENTVAE